MITQLPKIHPDKNNTEITIGKLYIFIFFCAENGDLNRERFSTKGTWDYTDIA